MVSSTSTRVLRVPRFSASLVSSEFRPGLESSGYESKNSGQVNS